MVDGPGDGRVAGQAGAGGGHLSRRRFLGATGGLLAGLAVAGVDGLDDGRAGAVAMGAAVPFYGLHQAGVTTPRQRYTEFATFDVQVADRSELAALLRRWTAVAADLTQGSAPARLTVNVGFGPSLFGLGGMDRFGLADHRPVALVGLPGFPGDDIEPGEDGGDLTVQVCADDRATVARSMGELRDGAGGAATVRWAQAGFSGDGGGGVPRDPLGFKDGIVNPRGAGELGRFVWADGGQDQAWMAGGTYLVARRIGSTSTGGRGCPWPSRSGPSGDRRGRGHPSAGAVPGTLPISRPGRRTDSSSWPPTPTSAWPHPGTTSNTSNQ